MGWMDDFVQLPENLVVDGNNGGQDEPVFCDCHKKGLCCDDEACFNFSTQIECVDCRNPRCKNQRMQRRDRAKIEVRPTPMKHGYGLFAAEDIKKNQFILEFTGEVINKRTMEERSNNGSKQLYLHNIGPNVYLDATNKGSIARFTNHSCEPNAKHDRWIVKGKLCIGVFADKDIKKGEEFGFDYQWKPNQQKPTRCHCGTPSCRGFLEIMTEEDKAFHLVRKGAWRKAEEAAEEQKAEKDAKPLHEWLVEKRIRVFWPGNNRFWDANVEAWDAKAKGHRLYYTVDANVTTEQLLLPEDITCVKPDVRWEWLDETKEEETIKKRLSSGGDGARTGDEEEEDEIIVDREHAYAQDIPRSSSPRIFSPIASYVQRAESPRNEKVRRTVDVTFATAQYVVRQSLSSASSHGGFAVAALHDDGAVFARTMELVRIYCPGVSCMQSPGAEGGSPRDKRGKQASIKIILFGEEEKVNVAIETLNKSTALQTSSDKERERTVHEQLAGWQSPMLLFDWRVLPSLTDIKASDVANPNNVDVLSENAALTWVWHSQQQHPHIFKTPLTCSLDKLPEVVMPESADNVMSRVNELANRGAFQSHALSDFLRRTFLNNLRKSSNRLNNFALTTLHAVTLLIRYLSYSGATDTVSREAVPLLAVCLMLAEKARGNFTPAHTERIATAVYCEVYGRDDAGNIDPILERMANMEQTVLQVLRYDLFLPDVLSLTYAAWCPIEGAINDLWFFDRQVGSIQACGTLGVAIATTFPRVWQAMLPDVVSLVTLLVDCVACELSELRVYGGDALMPQTLFLAMWQVGSHTMRQSVVQMLWNVNFVASIAAKIPSNLYPAWFLEISEEADRRHGKLDWADVLSGVGPLVERWIHQGNLLSHQLNTKTPEYQTTEGVFGSYCRTRFPWLTTANSASGGVIDANKSADSLVAISKEMYSIQLPAVHFPTLELSTADEVPSTLRAWPTERAARKEAAQFKAAGMDAETTLSPSAAYELSSWQQMHYYSGLHALMGTNKNDLWELRGGAKPATSPYLAAVFGVATLSGSFQLPRFSKSAVIEGSADSHKTSAKPSSTTEDEKELDHLRSVSPRSTESSPRMLSGPVDALPPQRFLSMPPLNLGFDVIVGLLAKAKACSLISPGLQLELCRDLYSIVDHLTASGLVLRWLDPAHLYLTRAGRLMLGNLTSVAPAGGGALSGGIPNYITLREQEKERAREAKRSKDKRKKKEKRRHNRKRKHDEAEDSALDAEAGAAGGGSVEKKDRKRSRDERDHAKDKDKDKNKRTSLGSPLDTKSAKPVKVSKPSLPHLLSTAPEIVLGDLPSVRSGIYSAASVCLLLLCGRSLVKASDSEDQHLQYMYKILGTPTKEASAVTKYFQELPLSGTYALQIITPDGPQSTRSRAMKTLEGILPSSLLKHFSQQIQLGKSADQADASNAGKVLDDDMSDGGLLLDVLRGSLMLAPQRRFETAAEVLRMPLFSRQSVMNASERASNMQKLQENMKAMYSGVEMPHNFSNYSVPVIARHLPQAQQAYNAGYVVPDVHHGSLQTSGRQNHAPAYANQHQQGHVYAQSGY